jgi:hypothetical protein
VLLAINNASVRETQRYADKRNAAPIMRNMTGAACRLPGESPREGVAVRQEFVVNVGYIFIESHDTYL